jgi:hypothetical protein
MLPTTVMSILRTGYTSDMIWNRLSFANFHKIVDFAADTTPNFPGHALLEWLGGRIVILTTIPRSLAAPSSNKPRNAGKPRLSLGTPIPITSGEERIRRFS